MKLNAVIYETIIVIIIYEHSSSLEYVRTQLSGILKLQGK